MAAPHVNITDDPFYRPLLLHGIYGNGAATNDWTKSDLFGTMVKYVDKNYHMKEGKNNQIVVQPKSSEEKKKNKMLNRELAKIEKLQLKHKKEQDKKEKKEKEKERKEKEKKEKKKKKKKKKDHGSESDTDSDADIVEI